MHLIMSMFFQSKDFANIYLFSTIFSIEFRRWENVGLPHIAYTVIHKLSLNRKRAGYMPLHKY